jgi:glycerophosphoryl diester phosphodiesterase
MTQIIGHRGAAGLALENSPASIKAALALPIDTIELDLRRTGDGELVVIHDRHTGRVANHKVYVSEVSLKELQAIPLHNGEHLMSLDETLQLIDNQKHIVIDIKISGIAEELARIIAKHPKTTFTISSRKYNELEAIHELLPDLPFLAQSHVSPTEVVHDAHQLHATGISINKWLLNPYIYHLAKRAGLKVYVYTVNHPWLMWYISQFYPDVVVYTDHPERFLHLAEKKP